VAHVDGIPVTTPVRTVIDLAVVLDIDSLEEVLYSAMRMRLVSIEGIERSLDELGALRLGRKRVRQVLERARAGCTESLLETRFLQLLRRAGLPLPVGQFEIRSPTDVFIARVDFAYPDRRLAIELDGSRWHSIERDVARDDRRERRIVAGGYRIMRFTWRDVHETPEVVVAEVKSALGL